jgi:deoxyribodipyrimidine photo-lyase
VFNRLYEPRTWTRDEQLSRQLQAQGLEVRSFHTGLLLQPGSVHNQQGGPYRVYTPFYRKTRALLESRYADYHPLDAHRHLQRVKPVVAAEKLSQKHFKLRDEHPWHDKLDHYWQPGEQQGHALLDSLLADRLEDYPLHRDLPGLDGTSRLSPYLHFGELSPQQIYVQLQPLLAGAAGARLGAAAERFLSQLMWREFAHQVLWHHPHSSDRPLDKRYAAGFWRNNNSQFRRWTRGETGVPLVDAGMKQLWETGWMHNRVRMVVASFLTKNLGIHWLQGARWFWDTLVDADLANNSMGWQWVAGCGVDAAPYYRIFNPLTQARRFDADARYVQRWLPAAGQTGYPPPMVDLGASRERALQWYKQQIS